MDYSRARQFLDTLIDWETGEPHPGPVDQNLPRVRALLHRLGDPCDRFPTVIVGGTNGKGTVASLLSEILQDHSLKTGLYTSPHLFTLRERIRISGEIVSRDRFAAAVASLIDQTVAFERDGFGPYTRFEAMTALAALLFAEESVDVAIFEVGLGGQYDATNAWDSLMAVLTAIDLDHAAVLGNTPTVIAADKFHIARPGSPLVTTSNQLPEVAQRLEELARDRSVPLSIVESTNVESTNGDTSSRLIQPGADPVVLPIATGLDDRSFVYRQNAQLAAGAAHVLLQDVLNRTFDDRVVTRRVTEHRWPGRFDVVRLDPTVILDGAHNPSAGRALANDLKRRAGSWNFVVAVNQGHDAAGFLAAIAPIADRIVLTQTGHPKSISQNELKELLPEGTRHRTEAVSFEAIRGALESLSPEDHLCVTGSLRLVAHAMEVLGVEHERDGFSEDVILESLKCLTEAAQRLGFGLDPVTEDENVLSFRVGVRPIYFLRNKHPFNDYVSARLAEDKSYHYELFRRAGIRVPDTLTVFNPMADTRFDRYKTFPTLDAVLREVDGRFDYPVVVKRNRGSLSQGVHLENSIGARERLEEWCRFGGYLDNVFLIQEYLSGPEYRIVASQAELLLAYRKVSDAPVDPSELNPLHDRAGRAEKVTDRGLLEELTDLARAVADVIDLGFYAIDLIRTDEGLSILEINPNPICYYYNLSNGREDFIRIYQKLLIKYLSEGALDEGWLLRHVKKAVESATRAAD